MRSEEFGSGDALAAVPECANHKAFLILHIIPASMKVGTKNAAYVPTYTQHSLYFAG